MAEFYNARDIVGKTLYAKTSVPISRSIGGAVVYTAKPGEIVGTVTSWIDPTPGRNNNLWWEFEDTNNRTYYAEHLTGRYSTTALQAQGAQTVQQQQAAAAAANQTTGEKVMTLVKWAFGIGVLAYLAGTFIKTRKQ